MRPLVFSVLFGVWSISSGLGADTETASLDKAYAEAEKAYLQTVHQAQKPLLEQRLEKLNDWKARATRKEQDALVIEIDQEIQKVATELAKAKKALNDVQDLAPPPKPKDTATTNEPPRIKVDFAKATLEGGVVYDPKTKSLTGWKSRKAKATLSIHVLKSVTYDIELTYSSHAKGRIKVQLGQLNLLPDLKNTGGTDKSETIGLGEFTCDSPEATLTISLPLHYTKEFVQVLGLRLTPKKSDLLT